MVLKTKMNCASCLVGPDNSAVQLSDVIAVQVLYKLSLKFIVHLSGDFNHKHFLGNVCSVFMLNHYLRHKLNFLMHSEQKNIACRMSLFASSQINFRSES